MRVVIFPRQLSKVLCLPRKSEARSYEVLHLSRKIILANLKIRCSKMQRLSRNQRPDLLTCLTVYGNSCVSCTAPATRNASLQILCKCPTPAFVFWKCYKTLTFCSLLTRSTIPCACHAKAHLNVQKWSEPLVFFTSKAAGAEPAGQMRDEQVHAVVARSTFRSQNVQNTPGPDHFWKLRCRKSGRRCGAKHISKSKC